MNRRRWLAMAAAILLLLPGVVQRANPIIEGYFNELFFAPPGWRIEMHVEAPTLLDGWSLRSQFGQAAFRNGIQLGGVYRVITPESLLTPLAINPGGDTLTLFSPQHPMAFLWFGSGGMITAPRPGQSLCLREGGAAYYLDNTPTLGQPNDALNAMGTVTGRITDTAGVPIAGVHVDWGEPFPPLYSDTAGNYSLTDYASRLYFVFTRAGFNPELASVQVWPESTVTLNVVMDPAVSVEEDALPSPRSELRAAYPSPFNSTTTIQFTVGNRQLTIVKVYDVLGQEVATLVDGEVQAGTHVVTFDGSALPSGVYLVRLEAGSRTATQKVLLMR